MIMKRAFSAGFLLFLAFAAGCRNQTGESFDSSAVVVHLPVAAVKRMTLPLEVTAFATVSALPNHSVKAAPSIAGKIAAVDVVTGQRVKAGETVARLDSRQAAEQLAQSEAAFQSSSADAAAARSTLTLAESTRLRQKTLYQEKIAPKKDFLAAENQAAVARDQLTAAESREKQALAVQNQAAVQLSLLSVKSPISGIVARRFLNVGDTADPNTPIVWIVDLSQVIVKAALPADSSAAVRPGQRAEIILPSGKTVKGNVIAVSPAVDPQSNTIEAQIHAANPMNEMAEGLPVTVSIVTGHRDSPVVPSAAIVPNPDRNGGSMVYRVLSGKVYRVPVQTGVKRGNWVEILKGLRENDRIVVKGAYGIPDGTPIQ